MYEKGLQEHSLQTTQEMHRVQSEASVETPVLPRPLLRSQPFANWLKSFSAWSGFVTASSGSKLKQQAEKCHVWIWSESSGRGGFCDDVTGTTTPTTLQACPLTAEGSQWIYYFAKPPPSLHRNGYFLNRIIFQTKKKNPGKKTALIFYCYYFLKQ